MNYENKKKRLDLLINDNISCNWYYYTIGNNVCDIILLGIIWKNII